MKKSSPAHQRTARARTKAKAPRHARSTPAKSATATTGRNRNRRSESPSANIPESIGLSPTEERNPRSTHLAELPLPDAIALFLSEEASVTRHLFEEQANIAQAIDTIVTAFRRGGRLFYVGAGTSGRLGVLDASECPPTFRTPPTQVQGIIAGGDRALRDSAEGAEDDIESGANALRRKQVNHRDVVVGIAASGRTPFIWGALGEARKRRARTVLVTFNPNLRISDRLRPSIVIAPNLGPELLTGSTRLKAGTATKILLNMFSTLAMAKCGKVMENLMVDMRPSNAKLRARAVRILQQLRQISEGEARAALVRCRWNVKEASQTALRNPKKGQSRALTSNRTGIRIRSAS